MNRLKWARNKITAWKIKLSNALKNHRLRHMLRVIVFNITRISNYLCKLIKIAISINGELQTARCLVPENEKTSGVRSSAAIRRAGDEGG